MKFKHLFLAAALFMGMSAFAQPMPPQGDQKPEEAEGYKFEIIKELPITPVPTGSTVGHSLCRRLSWLVSCLV